MIVMIWQFNTKNELRPVWLINASSAAQMLTLLCWLFVPLWCRRSFKQTAGEQRLHHSQAHSGGPGHAVPVNEAHQRDLGAGWAEGADRKPKLHGEYRMSSLLRPLGFWLKGLILKPISCADYYHKCQNHGSIGRMRSGSTCWCNRTHTVFIWGVWNKK